MSPVQRNERCPCGSGKKYKRCCLANAEAAESDIGRVAHLWHTRESRCFERITAWMQRQPGPDWPATPLEELFPEELPDEAALELIGPWLVYQCPRSGVSPAQAYLDAQGPKLDARERDVIEANIASRLSIWEIHDVQPGVGLELYDALGETTRFVHDEQASRWAVQSFAVLGFVTEYPGVTVMGATHPCLFSPAVATDAVSAARIWHGVTPGPISGERLRSPAAHRMLFEDWISLIVESEREGSPPAGEPVPATKIRYPLEVNKRNTPIA